MCIRDSDGDRQKVVVADRDQAGVYQALAVGEPDYFPVCACLLYTSPSPRDRTRSRMPSSA